MTDQAARPEGSDSSEELGIAFDAWWREQNTGLGDAHRFTAWNAWLEATGRAVAAERACRKCGGRMRPGVAIAQTVDCSDEGTMSPAGPGVLIGCMKCEVCGWSVTRPRAEMSDEELEQLTGEPHIDGWPLYSGLPPAA